MFPLRAEREAHVFPAFAAAAPLALLALKVRPASAFLCLPGHFLMCLFLCPYMVFSPLSTRACAVPSPHVRTPAIGPTLIKSGLAAA